MDELISKAKVLKLIRDGSMPEEITGALLYESVKLMEPVQPEIVRCKDCIYYEPDKGFKHPVCDRHVDNGVGVYIEIKPDDYCSYAEPETNRRKE